MNKFANAIFIVGIVCSTAILLFVLNNHERFITSWTNSLIFVGPSMVGISIGIVALRLPDSYKLSAALTVISIVIGIYGAEGFLYYKDQYLAENVDRPSNFDARTKYQVVSQLRDNGVSAYPSVFPAFLMQTQINGEMMSPIADAEGRKLPLGGIANTKTVLCNESGQYVTFKSDRYGFNNEDGIWNYRKIDILGLGDSFTQGFCVEPPAHFMGRIHEKYNSTLNLGIGGNGPLLELASLIEFGAKIKPKTTLWFFFEGNDVQGDMKIERRAPVLMKYLTSSYSQNLMAGYEEIDIAYRQFIDQQLVNRPDQREIDAGMLQSVISFVGLYKLRSRLFGEKTHDVTDFALFRKILNKAKQVTNSWQGGLVFVYLPAPGRYFDPTDKLFSHYNQIHERVIKTVKNLGIESIDLVPVFDNHPDVQSLFPLRKIGHYNEHGHRLVSSEVLLKLSEQE